jgi:hypothetical protein
LPPIIATSQRHSEVNRTSRGAANSTFHPAPEIQN